MSSPHPLFPVLKEAAWAFAEQRLRPSLPFLNAKERSVENWICTELGIRLATGKLEPKQVRFEVSYPEPHRGRGDLVLGPKGEGLWVELAHIWSWTESKWNSKCREDASRLSERLKGEIDQSGCQLIFLLSRPSWYAGVFQSWVEAESKDHRLILIDLSTPPL